MKLMVIVLCLLSERFLVHTISHKRFHWFTTYCNAVEQRLKAISALSSPWLILILTLLPLLLITAVIVYGLYSLLFGLIGFLMSLIIFYYCIGPTNPFYPVRLSGEEEGGIDNAANYLAEVNGQLFAVVFWFIILGPLGVLTYRLISLSQEHKIVGEQARQLTAILDWLPARMTVLLYLVVGNFQVGLKHFSKTLFSAPEKNTAVLTCCGLQAARIVDDEQTKVTMPQAENLVEHAVIALLVLVAFFTLVA